MTTIILLFVGGLALVLMEVFVPGMIVGLIGTGMLVTAIYMAFTSQGAWLGATMIGVCAVVIPLVVGWALYRLRHKKTMDVADGFVSTGQDLREFLGARGESTTPLRPSGKGLVAGHTLDVMSEGPFIQPGTPIEVVAVKGIYLVVRDVTPS